MKKVVVMLLALVSLSSMRGDDECITREGFFRGKRLSGRVQFVEQFGDIKVEVVKHFPDLKVKLVDYVSDRPGEWHVVESNADIKVQVVEQFGDIKIQYVENFPGVVNSCE